MLNTSQCILICLREDIATTGPLWIARSPFARPTLTIGPWISIIELQSALSLPLAPGCHNFRLILEYAALQHVKQIPSEMEVALLP